MLSKVDISRHLQTLLKNQHPDGGFPASPSFPPTGSAGSVTGHSSHMPLTCMRNQMPRSGSTSGVWTSSYTMRHSWTKQKRQYRPVNLRNRTAASPAASRWMEIHCRMAGGITSWTDWEPGCGQSARTCSAVPIPSFPQHGCMPASGWQHFCTHYGAIPVTTAGRISA